MYVITEARHYSDIADAIRSHLKTSGTYTPSQMATAIGSIPNPYDVIATGGSIGGRAYGSATFITSSAFANYDGITEACFPECETIGSYAFLSCRSLMSASFPKCTRVDGLAFDGCSSLSDVFFPSLASASANAFRDCQSLVTASFPALESVWFDMFYGCSSLVTVDVANASNVGGGAFYGCVSLRELDLPRATSIGSSAFCLCKSLSSVSIPACATVSNFAFAGCWALSQMTIPPTTSSIGDCAFEYCFNLVSLYLTGASSVPSLGASAFFSTPIGGYVESAGRFGYVYVPSSLHSEFLTAPYWSSVSSRIRVIEEG